MVFMMGTTQKTSRIDETIPGVGQARRGDGPNARVIDADEGWRRLLARDSNADFFYAVKTTGVFCRLDCKSRRPLRENVQFFSSVEEARTAGFRACKRCKPTTAWGSPLDKVRAHIERHMDRAVPLAE